MAFSPTVAVSRAGKTVTRRSPICFVSPAPAPPGAACSPPAISIGRAPSMVTWPMPRAPIIPIMLSAAWSLLSESTRKLALVTTRSPAATPSSTSTASSKRPPRRTSRGTRRPSPPSANTTWRRPESSTAVLGTTRRSPSGTRSSTVPYISGRRSWSGEFGSSKRTFAVRVFASSIGAT